jgi:hypothetical protein
MTITFQLPAELEPAVPGVGLTVLGLPLSASKSFPAASRL